MKRLSASHLRSRPAADHGFSIAELTVAMFISSLVAAAAAGMVNMALQSSKASETRLTSINDARVSVESMSRTLRTAVLPSQLQNNVDLTKAAFLQASPRAVYFYANIDNPDNTVGPSRLTYTVTAGGVLVQTIQAPNTPIPVNRDYKYCDLSLASCARQTRALASGVDATGVVFRYFDQFGTELAPTATCGGAPCLDVDDMEAVDAVEVKVVLRPPANVKIGPTTYVTRVSLPNHDAVIRKESSS